MLSSRAKPRDLLRWSGPGTSAAQRCRSMTGGLPCKRTPPLSARAWPPFRKFSAAGRAATAAAESPARRRHDGPAHHLHGRRAPAPGRLRRLAPPLGRRPGLGANERCPRQDEWPALERQGNRAEGPRGALFAARSDRLVLFDAEDDATYADAVDILDVIRQAGGRIGIGFSPAQ